MSKKENKPRSKAFKIFQLTKNILFGVILALLAGVIIVVIIAQINGETPKLFGNAVYRVASGSMAPYLQVGDIILVKDCDPMTLTAGDVITYNGTRGELAGKRVTHRVVKEPYLNETDGEYYLVTKGDDNPIEDTPIKISQVTGKYERKLELLKKLYDFFLTPWGLLALIGLIVVAFFNEILNFARALTGSDNEREHEDIQTIIERVQREDAEKMQQEENHLAEKTGDDEKNDS